MPLRTLVAGGGGTMGNHAVRASSRSTPATIASASTRRSGSGGGVDGDGAAPCLAAARFTPTVIAPGPVFHPELAVDAQGDAGRARLIALSADRATPWTDDGGALVTSGACP